MRKNFRVVLGFALVAPTAFAAGPVVLGIELDGKPFNEAQVCKMERGGPSFPNPDMLTEPCISPHDINCVKWGMWADASQKICPSGHATVYLPAATVPKSIINPIAVGFTEDFVPRSMMLPFKGVSAQDDVLALLVQKFGKPDAYRPKIVQNPFSAKYVFKEATWARKDGSYIVLMAVTGLESGGVAIAGKRAVKENREREKNLPPKPVL